MNKNIKNSILLIGLIVISGCSSSIKSNVTRFHQLPNPNGETIEVIAIDPSLQQSIEFGTYAQMIGKKLGTAGYLPPSGNASNFVAEISYTLLSSTGSAIENRPPISIGMGVGSGRGHGTSVGMGISTSFGSSKNQARFIARLSMNIVNLATGERLYEGHVENITREQNLMHTMPFMINALFENFPGESGTSNTVTVKPE